MSRAPILIEGLTPDDIVALDDLETFAIAGRPIIFRVGTAEVLAEFSQSDTVLKTELAVVEQGGEGVLPVLIDVIERAATRRGITAIEWWVYARNCQTPNPKLARVLERLGFEIRELQPGSEIYWQRLSTNASLLRRDR